MLNTPNTFEEAFDLVASEALAEAERMSYIAYHTGMGDTGPVVLLDVILVMDRLRHLLWHRRGWLHRRLRQKEIDRLWNRLGAYAIVALAADEGKTPFEVVQDLRELMIAKQRDYGPHNILDFGELGCLIRANDKVRRLDNLYRGRRAPENEPLMDSWRDLANYAIIARMVRRGWFDLPLAEEAADAR